MGDIHRRCLNVEKGWVSWQRLWALPDNHPLVHSLDIMAWTGSLA
ncbi:hypothetical protein GFS31_35170 [Leptolyngbya sp. BL0902]|nr:hypothetical protein GFS31_35170 [Leptolyngbya sp. BL0902]